MGIAGEVAYRSGVTRRLERYLVNRPQTENRYRSQREDEQGSDLCNCQLGDERKHQDRCPLRHSGAIIAELDAIFMSIADRQHHIQQRLSDVGALRDAGLRHFSQQDVQRRTCRRGPLLPRRKLSYEVLHRTYAADAVVSDGFGDTEGTYGTDKKWRGCRSRPPAQRQRGAATRFWWSRRRSRP
jgi:hypothetical protein